MWSKKRKKTDAESAFRTSPSRSNSIVQFDYAVFDTVSKRKKSHPFFSSELHTAREWMLLPGVPAAHRLIRLMLLPSRPDMVHGRKLHGTRPSTHPLLPCGKTSNGMRLFNYTTFPLALQGENERFFHFSNYTKKQLQTVRKNDMILICALFFCEQMYCEYRMRAVFSVQHARPISRWVQIVFAKNRI